MAAELELRERQKNHLGSLLKLKKLNEKVIGLKEEILNAILGMDQEDVALVEKLVGVKAID